MLKNVLARDTPQRHPLNYVTNHCLRSLCSVGRKFSVPCRFFSKSRSVFIGSELICLHSNVGYNAHSLLNACMFACAEERRTRTRPSTAPWWVTYSSTATASSNSTRPPPLRPTTTCRTVAPTTTCSTPSVTTGAPRRAHRPCPATASRITSHGSISTLLFPLTDRWWCGRKVLFATLLQISEFFVWFRFPSRYRSVVDCGVNFCNRVFVDGRQLWSAKRNIRSFFGKMPRVGWIRWIFANQRRKASWPLQNSDFCMNCLNIKFNRRDWW